MRGVGRALARIADAEPERTIVLPAHRNPVVREAVLPALEGLDNVLVTEPLAYGEFTHLMDVADVVLTESGGVQEEAPSLGKPVLVMRDATERRKAQEALWAFEEGLRCRGLAAVVGEIAGDTGCSASCASTVAF